jgi:hypothetical protein
VGRRAGVIHGPGVQVAAKGAAGEDREEAAGQAAGAGAFEGEVTGAVAEAVVGRVRVVEARERVVVAVEGEDAGGR